jgi:hypothetical protein
MPRRSGSKRSKSKEHRKTSKKNSRKTSRKNSRKINHNGPSNSLYDDFTNDLINDLGPGDYNKNEYNNLQEMANPMMHPMTNPTFNPSINSLGKPLDPKSIDPLHLNYMVPMEDNQKTTDMQRGITYEQMMNPQGYSNYLSEMSRGMTKRK